MRLNGEFPQRSELPDYARRYIGAAEQEERNGDIRFLGQGGLLVTADGRGWYSFSEETGGGLAELIAWHQSLVGRNKDVGSNHHYWPVNPPDHFLSPARPVCTACHQIIQRAAIWEGTGIVLIGENDSWFMELVMRRKQLHWGGKLVAFFSYVGRSSGSADCRRYPPANPVAGQRWHGRRRGDSYPGAVAGRGTHSA